MSKPYRDPVLRFYESFEVSDDGCWLWKLRLYPNGYGSLGIKKDGKWGLVYAHRFAYETIVGPIPAGLDLDHLCRVRHCVNPDHLEPVTRQENLRRGINANRAKTHCPEGHEYSPENTYVEVKPNGRRGRKCITCCRARDKERWAARKAA